MGPDSPPSYPGPPAFCPPAPSYSPPRPLVSPQSELPLYPSRPKHIIHPCPGLTQPFPAPKGLEHIILSKSLHNQSLPRCLSSQPLSNQHSIDQLQPENPQIALLADYNFQTENSIKRSDYSNKQPKKLYLSQAKPEAKSNSHGPSFALKVPHRCKKSSALVWQMLPAIPGHIHPSMPHENPKDHVHLSGQDHHYSLEQASTPNRNDGLHSSTGHALFHEASSLSRHNRGQLHESNADSCPYCGRHQESQHVLQHEELSHQHPRDNDLNMDHRSDQASIDVGLQASHRITHHGNSLTVSFAVDSRKSNYSWSEADLNVYLPTSPVSDHVNNMHIDFKVHINNGFHFPTGTKPVSAIYSTSTNISSEVKLELEHCFRGNEKSLVFAYCQTSSPPFYFHIADRREYECSFTYTHGTIKTKLFPYMAIVRRCFESPSTDDDTDDDSGCSDRSSESPCDGGGSGQHQDSKHSHSSRQSRHNRHQSHSHHPYCHPYKHHCHRSNRDDDNGDDGEGISRKNSDPPSWSDGEEEIIVIPYYRSARSHIEVNVCVLQNLHAYFEVGIRYTRWELSKLDNISTSTFL